MITRSLLPGICDLSACRRAVFVAFGIDSLACGVLFVFHSLEYFLGIFFAYARLALLLGLLFLVLRLLLLLLVFVLVLVLVFILIFILIFVLIFILIFILILVLVFILVLLVLVLILILVLLVLQTFLCQTQIFTGLVVVWIAPESVLVKLDALGIILCVEGDVAEIVKCFFGYRHILCIGSKFTEYL